MSRRRQDVATVRISDEEYSRLESKFESLKNEFAACRRKLDSKCEALLILSQELDQCRSERDQFKLMAEQLRERCQSMKRSLSGKPKQSTSDTGIHKKYTDAQSQNLARLLYESKEGNKSLQFEIDDLKQKLHDAQGDIKLLREQIARSRVGTIDEGMSTRHFPAHEREELVQKLESSSEQYLQLERDLQTVLDEKEELVTERDVYKTKYERLNQELNYILKGDENRVVDIDALVMENKYLQDRLKQMEEEKSMAMAAVSKYKSLLEKKKSKSSMKFGQTRGGGMIITQKQVQQVLESKQSVLPSPQAMSDLQALAGALLDSVNDKNLALSHQRKTNKILGNRVAELEKKIKTLECAGLWNIPANVSSSLEKLKQDCDDMKMLIPRKHSDSDLERLSPSEGDRESELETVSPLDSTNNSPMTSPLHTAKLPAGHLDLNDLDTDLDLLPTKEVPTKYQHVEHCEMFQYPGNDLYRLSSIDHRNITQYADNDAHKGKDFSVPREYNSENTAIDKDKKHDTETFGIEDKHSKDTKENPSCEASNTNDSNEIYDADTEDIEQAVCLSGEVTQVPQSVHVYNQDKLEETVESNDDKADADGDDHQGNCTGQSKRSGNVNDDDDNVDIEEEIEAFYNNDDSEATEKVGLLMESAMTKMCNISHPESTGNEEETHDDDRKYDEESEDSVKCRKVRKEKERTLSQEVSTDGHPLLGSQGNSVDESLVTHDEPHDVEC